MYATGGFSIPGTLIRIEIDPVQMVRNRVPDLGLAGDARATLGLLLAELGPGREGEASQGEPLPGSSRADSARRAAYAELSPAMQRQVAILDAVRDALPGCVVVGDSTQAVYAGNLYFEAERRPAGSTPRPATGRSATPSPLPSAQARRA
jgi:acetolactate synthase-1/2/3 large subunit